MANEKKNIDINGFLFSINNMLESKYILVDRRISDVLLSIANTDVVYNLIAECMINFDFRYEWKRATEGNYLKFPETNSKKISFIFCMLNNIDDRKIDITMVLDRYFSYDLNYSPYELFCRLCIAEFRDLILKELNLITDNTIKVEEDVSQISENTVDEDYIKLIDELRNLANYINSLKKYKSKYMQKHDVIAVLSTFEQVVRNRQPEYVYSFLVTINSLDIKDKNIKKMIAEINKYGNNIIARG